MAACSPTPTMAMVGVPDFASDPATTPEMIAARIPSTMTAPVTRKNGLRSAVVLSRFDTSHAAWRLFTSTNSETNPVSGSSSAEGLSSASSNGTSSRPSSAATASASLASAASVASAASSSAVAAGFAPLAFFVDLPFRAAEAFLADFAPVPVLCVVSPSLSVTVTSSPTGVPRSSMFSPAVPFDTCGSGESPSWPSSLPAITKPPCTARPMSGEHSRNSPHHSVLPRSVRPHQHRRPGS